MSIIAWIDKAKVLAYGVLKLKPWEFEELTLFEFSEMVEAFNEVKMAERWEFAYWVANIVSPHLKKPVKAEVLMAPFLKPVKNADRAKDAEEFFAEFAKQRKEAGIG